MSNPVELALVRKAIESGLGGCVEWHPKIVDRVAVELARYRLTLKDVRTKLIEYIRAGGQVHQVKEERTVWLDEHEYWYKVIVPVSSLKKGLFVEIVLSDSDPDVPEIFMVNAHEQQ